MTNPETRPANILYGLVTGALAVMPLCAAVSPRFFGFIPAVLAILGFALYHCAYREWPALNKRYTVLAAGIVLLCALSAFWSFDAATTMERTAKIALVIGPGALLFSLLQAMNTQKPGYIADILARFMPLAMLAGGLVILADLYGGGFIYNAFRMPEAEMNLSRINRSVISYVFLLLPAMWLLLHSRGAAAVKYALMLFMAVMVGAIVLGTQSQSAHMALVSMAAVILLFPVRRRMAWTLLLLAVLLGIALAPWASLWMFETLAALSKGQEWLNNAYAADRMEIWDMVARKALQNPVFGFGLDATRDIPRFETKNLYNPVDHVLHPHNFVLQLWIEFGAVGIGFFAAFFAVLIKAVQEQTARLARPLLSMLLALVLVACVSYGLWQAWWLGLFALLSVYGLVITQQKTPS